MALAFLPAKHIPQALEELCAQNRCAAIEPLLQYIDKQWISGGTFPPRKWSVYGQFIRTNNDSKGWNRRLNTKAGPINLPLYKLIQLIREEAEFVGVQTVPVEDGRLESPT